MPINSPTPGSTSLAGVRAVAFDIVGTLLDTTGSTVREVRDVLGSTVPDDLVERIAGQLGEAVWQRMDRISAGEEPFALETDLRREQLTAVLDDHRLRLDDAGFERLVTVSERLDAFDDAARQLADLERQLITIGLTNSALDQIVKASARTGLRWHALLGAQLAGTYKPAAAAYRLIPDLLHIDPAETLFVAAHPWDLRAAARAGFRTAYLPRPHADELEPDDSFELTIASLDEITAVT